jgi:hypothetical protein
VAATGGIIYLESGKWRWRVDSSTRPEVLELIAPADPQNKMLVTLPFSWRQMPFEELHDLARKPEIRLWLAPGGTLWRVAAVGPGTYYEYPLTRRHLVFDSQHEWSGIVEFPHPAELGDLTSDELLELRDRISDFGGRRRRYRAYA